MADLLDADVPSEIEAALLTRAEQASQALLHAAQQVLTGARSGRIYHRRGQTHQASAPGEPPAEDTGALRASWQTIPPTITTSRGGITITAGIRTEGTAHAFRFDPALQPYIGGPAPRPFVAPILDLAQPEIDAIFAAPLAVGA